MIFYYGHVACLYINKFRVAGLLDQVTDYCKHLTGRLALLLGVHSC